MKVLATLAVAAAVASATPVAAERLRLSYLPPDYPPTDICRAPAEQVGDDETQVAADEGEVVEIEREEWLAFIRRDVRALSREDAEAHFEFISRLITLRAEIDPDFVGADEAFARIDLHIDAGRFDELREAALIEALADEAEALSQSERVRLARYFLTGVGVAADPARGEAMLTNEAYAGNANALLELLRLQLAGVQLADWFEPPERTAALALGGKLGQLNRGLCGRAEFIASAYEDGAFLEPNPALAFAWRKFAADQGGQDAAWRVVEYMLNAEVSAFDVLDMAHYLRLAVDREFLIDGRDIEALRGAGAVRQEEILTELARLHGHDTARRGRSAVPFFTLDVAVEDGGLDGDSPHLAYLREVTRYGDVPGMMWTRLANEIVLQVGRWAGEAEAMDALQRAVAAGDAAAHVKLARMYLRRGLTTGHTSETARLLSDAVDVYGHAPALREVDAYHRCLRPDAPQLPMADAGYWLASHAATLDMDDRHFEALSSHIRPETAARVQRLAMAGSPRALSGLLQHIEADGHPREAVLAHWATRVERSKKALELFALGDYELAHSPEAAAAAVDFVRRATVSIGPAMELDLAITLSRHDGRSAELADEIRALLAASAGRGEGAAMRLLQRLEGVEDDRLYQQFADAIETRGDFLALMFAMPFVDDTTFDDYMARAVALMSCGTKDVNEIAEAHAMRGDQKAALHWLQVSLAIDGGHSMSRLRTKRHERAQFDDAARLRIAGIEQPGLTRMQQTFALVATPGEVRFDRADAADLLAFAFVSDDAETRDWAFAA
ncbi:MAG: hypothetical protein AAF762_05470, partial [Pseudomonadota bacterium]